MSETEVAGPRRVILVSNRLPISIRLDGTDVAIERSTGGLATGLSRFHAAGDSLWIGWPGETWKLTARQLKTLRRRLEEERTVPVELSAAEFARFYDGFANGVLWPLLHYQIDRLPLNAEGWDSYVAVNRKFAEAVIARYRPGDVIWVHDYQLALVPGMLREQLPEATIGFFLHVPFPSAEVFRLLPWRRQLLEGILGADLVGMHTVAYVLHFLTSAANVLACETRPGLVTFGGRSVRVATFPMGVDARDFATTSSRPGVVAESERLAALAGGAPLIVSVDRLDYTKGIPRRLLAFERLLEKYPELQGNVRLVQVAAPSRGSVSKYREFGQTVNEIVGRINGRFARPGYDPINYITQNLDKPQLVALFRAAAVALVTPLRDGMNLVAKEFVASRVDGDGVLILSEFAGAAAELSDALQVNPYDREAVADALHDALGMAETQRRERMARLRHRVEQYDIHRWAADFMDALCEETADAGPFTLIRVRPPNTPEEVIGAVAARGFEGLAILLDYDGTLVGLRPTPEEASPDTELMRLLAELHRLPGVEVHVVSGRRRQELEMWLGALPIGLHAEHGLWSRAAGRTDWLRRAAEDSWLTAARQLIEARVEAVPGSFMEAKEASIAWHYRRVPVSLGKRQAALLIEELSEALAGARATTVHGERVVEVRSQDISKALIVRSVVAGGSRPLLIVGDDTTDEDMFAAAPSDAVTVHVGLGRTEARMSLIGPDQVRTMLMGLSAEMSSRARELPSSTMS